MFNCNPNVVNSLGRMAVHYLAMKNHWLAINYIINARGELDHIDNTGKTALTYAVQYERLEATRTLLLANCNPHTIDDERTLQEGQHPLHMALRAMNYPVARWILLAGSCVGPLISHLPILEQHPPDDLEVCLWMRAWARQPHTLRHLCRVVIRDILRSRRHSKTTFDEQVDNLPRLPPAFTDFIRLREITDEHVNWSVTLA